MFAVASAASRAASRLARSSLSFGTNDFISVANFAADPAANEANVFKNFLLKSDGGDLSDLVAMVKAGKLTVPVDSVVPFADVPAALAKSSAQANAGKIVVDVAK